MNSKKAPKENINLEVGYLTCNHKILFEKRPEKGLFSGLFGLPASEDLKTYLMDCYGLNVNLNHPLKEKSHTFTHKIWHMKLYEIELETLIEKPNSLWVTPEEIQKLSVPTAFKKLLPLKS